MIFSSSLEKHRTHLKKLFLELRGNHLLKQKYEFELESANLLHYYIIRLHKLSYLDSFLLVPTFLTYIIWKILENYYVDDILHLVAQQNCIKTPQTNVCVVQKQWQYVTYLVAVQYNTVSVDCRDLFSRICGCTIKLTPSQALLLLEPDIFPYIHRTVIMHTLIAARLKMTKYWTNANPPTSAEIIYAMNKNCLHTKIRLQALINFLNSAIIGMFGQNPRHGHVKNIIV